MIGIAIDTKGLLHIKRNKKLIKQKCPFSSQLNIYCGDWCPQFGTPSKGKHDVMSLDLCHDKIWSIPTKYFQDNRGN